eukprot:scaffold51456_cov63-Phaeocystis_antarctica.AAC.3
MLRERTRRSAVGGGGGGAVCAVKSQCGGAVARWRKRRVGPGVRWAVGLTWGPTHLACRWVGGVEEDANETKPIKATASVRVIAEQLTAMVAGSGAAGAD